MNSVSIEDGELKLNLSEEQSAYLQENLLAIVSEMADKNPETKQEIVDKVLIPASLKYARGYIIAGSIGFLAIGYIAGKMRG
jgi:hypothetical protein